MKTLPMIQKSISADVRFIVLLFIVGIIAFSNTLVNGFVADDIWQIVKPTIIHSPINIPQLLFTSIPNLVHPYAWWTFYYRGLMFATFSLLYFIGHGQPFIFHLTQLLVHSLNAVLLLYFLKHWIEQPIAFLLACIFLVHPANQETVAAIANLQDTMFFCFGIAALLINTQKNIRWSHIVVTNILLLLSLLSKESGAVFFFFVLFFIMLWKEAYIIKYVFTFGLTIVLYCCMRLIAAQHYFVQMRPNDIIHFSFQEKLTAIPTLFSFYIQELILPDMKILTPQTTMKALGIPFPNALVWIICFGTILSCIIYIVHRNHRSAEKILFFFVVWFLLGICLHLQFIPLEALAAKRWLYIPLAGLLGIIGIGIQTLVKKPRTLFLLLSFGVILSLFWLFQTITMNTHWKDEPHIRQYSL